MPTTNDSTSLAPLPPPQLIGKAWLIGLLMAVVQAAFAASISYLVAHQPAVDPNVFQSAAPDHSALHCCAWAWAATCSIGTIAAIAACRR